MAKYYSLLPLPQGRFEKLSLVDRAVFGMIYERWKLGSYKLLGGSDAWYDYDADEVFCIYAHDELARLVGVSEKTIRRSLLYLRDEAKMISWRKTKFMGACRYYIARDMQQEMNLLKEHSKLDRESPQSGQIVPLNPVKMTGLVGTK